MGKMFVNNALLPWREPAWEKRYRASGKRGVGPLVKYALRAR